MAHYDACYGGHDMTCQDCIHIQADEDKGRYHCEECIYGDTYVSLDCPINRWCDNKFEPKEDSWESVSK
jgi:hypothetical protein